MPAFLATQWNDVWGSERNEVAMEELAAECMGLPKWDPPCPMTEPFIHNVVSTSKVSNSSSCDVARFRCVILTY